MPCNNALYSLLQCSLCASPSAAYDPSNLRFQEASTFFWDRYSQELDSWRDQPLWSYTLHHFNITPAVLFKKSERREWFIMLPAATRGFGGHLHDESNDHDATDFRENQTENVLKKKRSESWSRTGNVAVPPQGSESNHSVATHSGNNTHYGNNTICFVTSVFGTSVEKADKPRNVENIFPNDTVSEYDFFLFTNLENLISPGWMNIALTDLPYRRFITHSRWGKFVGWRHKDLAHCGTVIYMDAYVKPQKKKGLAPFRRVAAQVAQSEAGLAQVNHVWNGKTMDRILEMIIKNKKDVAANTNATMRWFREQPDFNNTMPYYINKWFGKYRSIGSIMLCNDALYSPFEILFLRFLLCSL
jgi:hypothetical protein